MDKITHNGQDHPQFVSLWTGTKSQVLKTLRKNGVWFSWVHGGGMWMAILLIHAPKMIQLPHQEGLAVVATPTFG
jgi:hypothetical protein